MTAQEMEQEFLILYDKITNFDAPGYEPLEISIFLTKAQERIILREIRAEGNKYQEGFEETEIRRKDLNELVKGITITIPAAIQLNTLPNGVFYDLPEDFLYAISEEITTSSEDDCKNGVRLLVKPTTHDEYAINVKNPFKKPSILRYAWRIDYSDKQHELITDATFSVAEYHLRYLKTLVPIIIGADTVDGAAGPLDCELNPILHKRIVDEAVRIATGITDPEKYQIKNIEQQAGE
jgi:hypothetical protein